MNSEPLLRLHNVRYGWTPGSILIDIDRFEINHGESVFLRGPSGSGKSTLLGLIGGVIGPRSGEISVLGQSLSDASPARRDRIRADYLGIIFQQFNLLPYLSVTENITLPIRFSRVRRTALRQASGTPEAEAARLIERLGLPESLAHQPISKLSVGQQQRVAMARALIGGPDLIIADEPTSALDTENRDRFIELLNEERMQTQTGLLFVSHDSQLATHFDRVIELEDLNAAKSEEAVS